MIDKIDKIILNILQNNADISLTELSKKVGISVTPCWNRIKKMEKENIILSKITLIDHKKINLPLIAFLSISIPNHTSEWLSNFTKIIDKYDQIIETHRIAVEGYRKKKDKNRIDAPKIRLNDADGLSRDVHSFDPSKYANLIHRI